MYWTSAAQLCRVAGQMLVTWLHCEPPAPSSRGRGQGEREVAASAGAEEKSLPLGVEGISSVVQGREGDAPGQAACC